MTKAIKQARELVSAAFEGEGGVSLLIGLPALVYFFGSMAFQPF